MAKRSMIDALLNQDKEYDYGMLLPFKTRRGMDPDQLSTDYMEGDTQFAVPEIASDMWNAAIKGGQMGMGERPIDHGEVTKIATEFLPGALAAGGATRAGMKGAVLGANVFQGGPHKYGPEGAAKSLEHIGKGEGAQAYGYGRYDAGAEGVARDYKINVPHQDIKRSFLKELPEDAEIEDVMGLLGKGHFSENQERVIRALNDDDWLGFEYPASAISAVYSKNIDNWDPSDVLRRAVDDAGYLYKHDLPDDDIARYLDWDKPLSEQSESVRAAVAKLQGREPDGIQKITDETMGREIESIARWITDDPNVPPSDKLAAENLGRAGIPGLQYYDQMSRAKAGGEIVGVFQDGGKWKSRIKVADRHGNDLFTTSMPFDSEDAARSWAVKEIATGTRNYVTWDQGVLDRMKLLERNGENMIDALR